RRHRRMTGPIDARTTRTGLEARYRGVAVAADLTDAALGVDADLRTPRVRWIGDLPDAGVARAGAAAARRTTGVVLRGYAGGLVLTARFGPAGSGGGGLVRGGSQRDVEARDRGTDRRTVLGEVEQLVRGQRLRHVHLAVDCAGLATVLAAVTGAALAAGADQRGVGDEDVGEQLDVAHHLTGLHVERAADPVWCPGHLVAVDDAHGHAARDQRERRSEEHAVDVVLRSGSRRAVGLADRIGRRIASGEAELGDRVG